MPAATAAAPDQKPVAELPPVSAAALGSLLGISDRAVRDMAKAGHVVAVGRNKFDVAASVPRYCAHLRQLATGRGGEAAIATGTAARARLAAAQASLVETKSARLRGALLDVGDVERQWSAILSGIRARLLAVPSRAAQRLPHLGPHDVGEIDREIRDALAELGEDRAA
jgi:phage terminase Nu1 subunit (DNA packaging protein)